MAIAFVLGNGVSRQSVDLSSLKELGKIYGCNALYRDYVPDVLVATDRPIAAAIQNSGYAHEHVFYTRRPLENSGALTVPKQYFGYSSGPIATGIAAINGCPRIYMIGFDMGPAPNNKINNLYAGTEFYRAPDSPPTYTGNWIKQITQIARDHPQTRFIRIVGDTTASIKEFEPVFNVAHLDMHTFLTRINNKKDL